MIVDDVARNHWLLRCFASYVYAAFTSQEVGGTLIGEDGLVVMAVAESVEWYQTHGLMPNIFYF
jgi:hypothetical protein